MRTVGACIIVIFWCVASVTAKPMSDTAWTEDVRYFSETLKKSHCDPFTVTSENDFDASIDRLFSDLPSMTEDQRIGALLRIVASIGDAHTTLDIPRGKTLPVGIYWFDDGLTVYNCSAPYKKLLNGIIISLNGIPIRDVIERLTAIIPHENDAQLKNTVPSWITRMEVLKAAGIITQEKSVTICVRSNSGKLTETAVVPIGYEEVPNVVWAGGLPDEQRKPYFLKDRSKFYWFVTDVPTGIVYCAYNVCAEWPKESFADFQARLLPAIDSDACKALVIDLRNNGGGNSAVFDPLIDAVIKRKKAGTLPTVYCVVGRRTFSSAILNAMRLRTELGVIVIGEPTGGSPNHFGEVKTFTLPNSGMTVSYSTNYFKTTDSDSRSLLPDIPIGLTLTQYSDYRDPVWDYIVKNIQEQE